MAKFTERYLTGFGVLAFTVAVFTTISFILSRYFNIPDNTIVIFGVVSVVVLLEAFNKWSYCGILRKGAVVLGATVVAIGLFSAVMIIVTFLTGLSLTTGLMAGFSAVFLFIMWLLILWARAGNQRKSRTLK